MAWTERRVCDVRLAGMQRLLRRTAPLFPFLALALTWEVVARVELVKPSVLPSPWETAESLLTLLNTRATWTDVSASVRRMALALGAGGSAGFLVGLVMWRLPLLGRGWRPVLSSLYAVPLSTFYPALLLATGVGDIPVVLLGAAAALPAVAVATSIGLAEVPSVFFKLARVYRCSWRQALWKLLLPAALPDLIAGVRLAMIYSLIYVVALEFINADNGLGFLLRFNYEFFRPKDMYAYVLLVVCLALFQHTVLDYVVGRLRQRFE